MDISSYRKATDLRLAPSYRKSFKVSGKIVRSENEFTDSEIFKKNIIKVTNMSFFQKLSTSSSLHPN